MGRLSDAKTLGGIGSILQIFPILNIVGYILTLIAVKYISDEVNDGTIFSDMLYAVITGIIGVTVGAFVLIFGGLLSIFTAGLSAFFGGLTFLAIVWVVLIVSSIFVKRAFDKIAARLDVGTFSTAGTLYFVGAILTIVLIGFVILFIAFILQVVAFFSIRETQPTMQTPMSSQGSFKYCPSCGSQIPVTVAFCPKCGAKQP